MKTKPFLLRVAEPLLGRVDAWGEAHGVNRTVAINLLIDKALQADEGEVLRAEIAGLREMVIKLATVHATIGAENEALAVEWKRINALTPGRMPEILKTAINSKYGAPSDSTID